MKKPFFAVRMEWIKISLFVSDICFGRGWKGREGSLHFIALQHFGKRIAGGSY